MDQDRDHPQRAAQGEGAGVAHEHLRGMTVEPKKAQARANHCRTKHGQFTGAVHVRDLQIGGGSGVSSQVSQRHKHERNDQRAADCQSVESVGQIDGVGAANYGEDGEGQADAAGGSCNRIFVEGDHDVSNELAGGRHEPQIKPDEEAEGGLH